MRRLSWVLSIILLLVPALPAGAFSFQDTIGTRYEQAFGYLTERRVVQGFRDGSGRPLALLNRAEALKVILTVFPPHASRVEWFRIHMPPLPLFADVDQRAWYAPFVEAAFQAGVIQGYPDGLLRPARPISVEEAIVLLMRAAGEETNAMGEAPWYDTAVRRASERNLFTEQLRLGTAITRGQFFDMVYRLSVIREQEVAPDSNNNAIVRAPDALPFVTPPTPVQDESIRFASEKPFAVTIPSLGIEDLSVLHPEDPFTHNGILVPLRNGVGHLFSYPGAGGKILIYGHSSGYPWDVSQFTKIFRRVNELRPGDRVYITYGGTLHVYEVTREQRVRASDTTAFQGEGEELILYTCWPPDSIAERYLVFASPVQTLALR